MDITAPNIPTHCYINSSIDRETKDVNFYLYGNIPWNNDLFYGKYDSLEKAVNASKLINCDLPQNINKQ